MTKPTKHICGNCGLSFTDKEVVPLNQVKALGQRLDPGSEVPSGECPNCNAFCYRREQPVKGGALVKITLDVEYPKLDMTGDDLALALEDHVRRAVGDGLLAAHDAVPIQWGHTVDVNDGETL